MRVLLVFLLYVHAIYAEMIPMSGKKLACPSLVGKSDKHHYEIEKVGKLWEKDIFDYFDISVWRIVERRRTLFSHRKWNVWWHLLEAEDHRG